VKRLHPQVFCRPQGSDQLHQLGEGKAAPRNRHRPGLDAAVAIEPLLQRHPADQVIDADFQRLLHHAIDLDGPWPQLQRLRRLGDVLARTELVEIVVAEVDLLVGDRPVERVFFIAADRIEIPGRVRQIADALGERKLGRERQRGRGARRQQTAAVQEEVFGRGKAFGDFPPAAANDVHRPSSRSRRSLRYARNPSRASHGCGRAERSRAEQAGTDTSKAAFLMHCNAARPFS
jgi:hypothetical protein